MEAELVGLSVVDLSQVGAEAHGRSLGGLAVDPDRPLGSRSRVVDAAHEVPRELGAVGAAPDAGRPPPLGVARVVAGGVVDHRPRINWPRGAAVQRERAARTDAGLLARPHLAAPVRTARLKAGVFVEREVELEAGVADAHAPSRELDSAAPHERVRTLAQEVLSAFI